MRSYGMPVYGKENEFGDMLVKVQVVIPRSLSDEQRTLFEKLREINR